MVEYQSIIPHFFHFIEAFKYIFNQNDTELLTKLYAGGFEGADISVEKVIETSHPYQRGKQQISETINYPSALAIIVELDPRCQTDHHSDYLQLISLNQTQHGHLMHSFSPNDALGTNYRFSGRPNLKKPLILLGSAVHIDFTAQN